MNIRGWMATAAAVWMLTSAVTFADAKPDAEPEEKKVEKAQTADPDMKICKRVSQVGTHFTRRVCYKKSRWARMDRESEQSVRDLSHDLPQDLGDGT